MKKVYLVVALNEHFDFNDKYQRQSADCYIWFIHSVQTSLKNAKRSLNYAKQYSSKKHAILVYDESLIDIIH
jgi:hypothetical protein